MEVEKLKEYLKQVVALQKTLYQQYNLWLTMKAQALVNQIESKRQFILQEEIIEDETRKGLQRLSPNADIPITDVKDFVRDATKDYEAQYRQIYKSAEEKVGKTIFSFNEPEPPEAVGYTVDMKAPKPPEIYDYALIVFFLGLLPGFILGFICMLIFDNPSIFFPVLVITVLIVILGIAIIVYPKDRKKYEKESEEYQRLVLTAKKHREWNSRKIKAEQAFKDNYNERVKVLIREAKSSINEVLNNEMTNLQDSIMETEKIYNELVSQNIIYPKYRDMIACTTIYEYFETGRVDSLEGANGAYNLYESEVRSNTIINQLEDIKNALNRLERIQYLMVSAIRETNSRLGDLKLEVSKLNETAIKQLDIQKEIAGFASITAMCSAATAANTSAIKYLALVK